MKLKIAFVGVAHWHASIYRECLAKLGIGVVGTSDIDAEAGYAAAQRLELPFERDATDMLARCRPDFVVVMPRHDRALEELAPVLDRRLPFLIEKPMGVNGRVAAEVARRAANSGAWAAPALPNRLLEIWDRFARLSAAGKLGTVMHANFRIINGPPDRYRTPHQVPWMLDRAISGGGALRNLGIHGADAILSLARGTAPRLHAACTTTHGHAEAVEEYATALMSLTDGAVVQLEAGYSRAPSEDGDYEWRIAATGAYLQQTKGRFVLRAADGMIEELSTPQPSYQPMMERVLADFGAGRPPFATLAECAAAAALCDLIYEAAQR
jgi:predicted dehydrogenase